jgi:LAO/AO transport system kinase
MDNLIGRFRTQGKSVGVIAIDPTSALTGGALLGDRIRMQRHSADSQVFIRSLATRGWTGGLARATLDTVRVMDAMGKDIILVETVGSGQVEMDIFRTADTTIVVLNPGSGDDIQMMKAGILEVVDIFVINKADKEGAEHLKSDLEVMLSTASRKSKEWEPPVVLTKAINDRGTAELSEVISEHHDYLVSGGGMEKRHRERVRLELLENIEGFVKDFVNTLQTTAGFEIRVDDILKGRAVPRRAAEELIKLIAEKRGEEQG